MAKVYGPRKGDTAVRMEGEPMGEKQLHVIIQLDLIYNYFVNS